MSPQPPDAAIVRRPSTSPVVRIPDAERERVVDLLRHHCGEGLLTLDEFAERAGLVFAAETSTELDVVISDLPAIATEVPDAGRRKVRKWVVAIMSGARRSGRWRAGDQLTAIAVMGGAEIDLRQAEFDCPELHIVAIALMGGIDIIVPEGIEVDLQGVAIMGGKEARIAPVPFIAGAPRIKVTAFPIMGGVDVRSKKSESELAKLREQHRALELERREERREERRRNRGRGREESHGHRDRRDRHDRQSSRFEGVWEPTADDADAVRRRVQDQGAPEGTVTILFSDIEGSTELTERLGDHQAAEIVVAHNEIVRAQVAAHGGFEVKSQGDGFMVAFNSAARALRCAIGIERAIDEFSQKRPDTPVRVRVGVNIGETVRDGNDFLGRAVIVASRLADAAEGGEILVSAVVRDLASSSGEFDFGEECTLQLKGLSAPQRAYSLAW